MTTLKLIHPKLGVCAIEKSDSRTREEQIKQMWRYRYGKKYLECMIEAEGEYNLRGVKIECIASGEVYDSIKDASKKTGVSVSTISFHVQDAFKEGNKHMRRFRYYDEKGNLKRPAAVYSNKNFAA